MSDLIEKVVSFLDETDAMKLGGSPWPSVSGGHHAVPIDWQTLFPRVRRALADRDPLLEAMGQEIVREAGMEDDPVLNPDWSRLNDPWRVNMPQELLGSIQAAIQNPDQYRKPERGLRVDVCAWYQPVHFYGYDWGIYNREDCLKTLAVQIAAHVSHAPGTSIPSMMLAPMAKACLRAAFAVYFLHEQYHHKTECFGIRNHVVLSRQVYVPYFKAVYLKLKGSDDHLEEALANADMWHRLATRPYNYWLGVTVLSATRDFLEATFPHEPPGYRKAVEYLEKPPFNSAENLLQGQIHANKAKPKLSVSRWDVAPRMLQSFLPITADIYTVVPAGATSALGSAAAPAKTCSTKEMVKLLGERGWELTHGGKGSHVKLKKPNAPTITLPGNRKDLSPGVTKQVLRILGGYPLSALAALLSGN